MKEQNTSLMPKARGFTLIEMMVVLLITSIVLLILGALSKATFDILRAGESRAQLTRNATLAIDYLARDIESATAIPRMDDRDLNGVPDNDTVAGYGSDARWVVGYKVGDNYFIPSSFFMSEAWSDHLKTLHASAYRVDLSGGVIYEELSPPKNIRIQGGRVASYTSYFRLAIPTTQESNHPYHLSSYGNVFLQNNTYPESVAVGFRTETAVLTQDITQTYRSYGEPEVESAKPLSEDYPYYYYPFYNQPIGTNITRILFEYFHEVPVYKVSSEGRVAYRNLANGDISFEDAPTWAEGGTVGVVSSSVPIIDHFELKHVDVVDNLETSYSIQDQYTDLFYSRAIRNQPPFPDPGWFAPPWGDQSAYNSWNIGFYWNNPPDSPDNPPLDHYAWTTDGEFRAIRYDTAYLLGNDNSRPTGEDVGNADGIPDGDGKPDDPVPTFWLPYVRAVRITIVATPTSVINQRLKLSGVERGGRTYYYTIDSPVPYLDVNRTVPAYSAKDFYVGEGKDVIVTRTVYLKKTFKLDLIIDPTDSRLGGRRRADENFFRGVEYAFVDPLDPDSLIPPLTPYQKYRVLNPN